VAAGQASPPVPREQARVLPPAYLIDVPDILIIDAIRLVPKPPYRIAPLDSILINVSNAPADAPVSGLYAVDPDGIVSLGGTYGSVMVAGLTLEEARAAIEKQLKIPLKAPRVQVSIGQLGGIQQIRGEHLVRPDGTIGLGKYGSARVAGLTVDQAKSVIESVLSAFLLNPEVSVDVFAYNSKTYYIVTDGGGYGEAVYRLPSTGNETVLDAISQIYGLPVVASTHRIYLVRPAPAATGGNLVLPVDWCAITRQGLTDTNYQVFPGDRIVVEARPLITLDTTLARVFSPIERIFGVTLLGSSTVHSIAIPLGKSTSSGF
jgi:polysaccharide export outer membrane protein